MISKLLILLIAIFYIAVQRTGDELWLFCLILCAILTICLFFYRREHKQSAMSDKAKGNSSA